MSKNKTEQPEHETPQLNPNYDIDKIDIPAVIQQWNDYVAKTVQKKSCKPLSSNPPS